MRWVLHAVCVLVLSDSGMGQTRLTIAAVPAQTYEVAAGAMMSFYIDIANDYCNDAAVAARGACSTYTPQAKLILENCDGESWLYVNHESGSQPTTTSYDIRSNNGTDTGYIEEATFALTLSTTYIGIYGQTAAKFQLFVSDTNFAASKVPRIEATLPVGSTNENDRGVLSHTFAYSGSVFQPSSVVVSYLAGEIANGATDAITYTVYHRRIGDVGVATAAEIIANNNTMSSACAILLHGTAGTSGTGLSNTFVMDIKGGTYVAGILGSTSSGYQGAYKALPFTFDPYTVANVQDDEAWKVIVGLIIALCVVVLAAVMFLFCTLQHKWEKRERAKQLLKEQAERKALMARGERYEPAKRVRKLTCWERITGEVQTVEDETYEDCLTATEREELDEFARVEMGVRGIPEPKVGRRPSTVVPSV